MDQTSIINQNLDYDRPIKLADGVFWVGFNDAKSGLQCNPYLIVDGSEAILIDGGSRPDFSTIMRKVLQAGVAPGQITHLIYQHYDPDLCGSIPNLEQIIDRPDLKLISKKENNPFIRHYSVRSKILCIDDLQHKLTMQSGRTLRFFSTPYAHSAGSFITHDVTSGILFTSDLFGSVGTASKWNLFAEIDNRCGTCTASWPNPFDDCTETGKPCMWSGLQMFHSQIMPSNASVRHAMTVIKSIGASMFAPQHGSILYRQEDMQGALDRIFEMKDIGIDGILARVEPLTGK
jgi:flavorubredoxin